MNKTIAQILVATVACSLLAMAAHWVMMSNDMDAGMSTGCATVCLTQGDSAPAVAPSMGAFLAVIIFFLLVAIVVAPRAPIGRLVFANFFQKDRHRYLMKTMVMLR